MACSGVFLSKRGTGMNHADAEEYTQSLAQIMGGGWRQILWAQQQGIPQALGLDTQEWVQRLGGYIKLTITERREASRQLVEEEGLSTREAAAVLGVDDRTVRRDLTPAANAAPLALEQAQPAAHPAANAVTEPPPTLAELEADFEDAEPIPLPPVVAEPSVTVADVLRIAGVAESHEYQTAAYRAQLSKALAVVRNDWICLDEEEGAMVLDDAAAERVLAVVVAVAAWGERFERSRNIGIRLLQS